MMSMFSALEFSACSVKLNDPVITVCWSMMMITPDTMTHRQERSSARTQPAFGVGMTTCTDTLTTTRSTSLIQRGYRPSGGAGGNGGGTGGNAIPGHYDYTDDQRDGSWGGNFFNALFNPGDYGSASGGGGDDGGDGGGSNDGGNNNAGNGGGPDLNWWYNFANNVNPEIAQSFEDAGQGIWNGAKQFGEQVADGVNAITDGSLYNRNLSNLGNASTSDAFSQTDYYENTVPNVLSFGVYGEGQALYQYSQGQLTGTQFTQQMAGTGFFQALGGIAPDSTVPENTPFQGWPNVNGSASAINNMAVNRLFGGTSSMFGDPNGAFWTTDPSPTPEGLGLPTGNTGASQASGTVVNGTPIIKTPGGAAPGPQGPSGMDETIIPNPEQNITGVTVKPR
jgi:hypothetical protein